MSRASFPQIQPDIFGIFGKHWHFYLILKYIYVGWNYVWLQRLLCEKKKDLMLMSSRFSVLGFGHFKSLTESMCTKKASVSSLTLLTFTMGIVD